MSDLPADLTTSQAPPQILLIDDQPNNLELLCQLFDDLDFDLATATTGKRAVELARVSDFEIAVIDIKLPDIDGFEVAEAIAALQPGCEIIFCSAHTDRAFRERAFTLGAIDFIEKPYDLTTTRVRIQSHLQRLSLKRQFLQQHDHLESMIESMQDAVVSMDQYGRIVHWNTGATLMFGASADEVIGGDFTRFMPKAMIAPHQSAVKNYFAGRSCGLTGSRKPAELPAMRADGKELLVELMLSAWTQKEVHYVTGIMRDVTEERALAKQSRLLNDSIEHSGAMVAQIDRNGQLLWFTSAFQAYCLPTLVRESDSITRESIYFFDDIEAVLADDEFSDSRVIETHFLDDSGLSHIATVELTAVTDESARALIIVTDVTELKGSMERNRQLQEQVYTDHLTHAKSRLGFMEALKDGSRLHDYGLLLIDIDYFKSVNDIYGHKAGDLYLKRLIRIIRGALGEDTLIGRLGGEEFAIVRPCIDEETLELMAQKTLLCAANFKLNHQGLLINRTISIGSALLTPVGSLSQTLSIADEALQVAKQEGRGTARYANKLLELRLQQRLSRPSMDEIERAIQAYEIDLYVQPIVDAERLELRGVETLARWNRDGHIVSPALFLEEYYSATSRSDKGRFRHRLFKSVVDRIGVGIDGYITYNIRMSDIFDGAIENLITDLAPLTEERTIVLELAEDLINERTDQTAVISKLETLREAGFKIAMDDFGKEGSNFNRLSEYPIDIVKIDKFFIRDIETNKRNQSLIRALVTLAIELDFDLIAEGVEEVQQADMLLRLGVRYHQGYHYSRAVPVSLLGSNMKFIEDNSRSLSMIERSRQEIIEMLDIVDICRDDIFLQSVVNAAREIFDVQASAITVLAPNHQYLVIRDGTELEVTPRTDAICNYTVQSNGVFEVCDTALDARFTQNKLTSGEIASIRFYTGSPITVLGRRVGALALIDEQPRASLTTFEINQLISMARAIAERITDLCSRDAVWQEEVEVLMPANAPTRSALPQRH
ncbi:MAG TPA: EAL domain-containing protein [Marinobacterium sp.]|nr:EAL domain-containing protein [Marinobacterium sp.]